MFDRLLVDVNDRATESRVNENVAAAENLYSPDYCNNLNIVQYCLCSVHAPLCKF